MPHGQSRDRKLRAEAHDAEVFGKNYRENSSSDIQLRQIIFKVDLVGVQPYLRHRHE